MGIFIFFIFIFIVIALVRKSSRTDKNLQKNDSSNSTQPNNVQYYFDDDDLFDDDDDFDDDLFFEEIEESNCSRNHFYAKNPEKSFFDRIMDPSTPESAFIKGLEDEGYDVEDW